MKVEREFRYIQSRAKEKSGKSIQKLDFSKDLREFFPEIEYSESLMDISDFSFSRTKMLTLDDYMYHKLEEYFKKVTRRD